MKRAILMTLALMLTACGGDDATLADWNGTYAITWTCDGACPVTCGPVDAMTTLEVVTPDDLPAEFQFANIGDGGAGPCYSLKPQLAGGDLVLMDRAEVLTTLRATDLGDGVQALESTEFQLGDPAVTVRFTGVRAQ